MGRAISVTQLISKRRNLLEFSGEWLDCFGMPELKGTWFIHGDSGHGKTSFILKLCKYLANFERVAYNSMEEGDSESFKIAVVREGMIEARRRFIILDNESIEELKERLRAHKAPKVVVIDSIQYSGMNYPEYKKLKNEFRDTLFIINSHADGKQPADRRAKSIRYDASVKIYVEGYVAYIISRYTTGGTREFTIWKKGADDYNGNI